MTVKMLSPNNPDAVFENNLNILEQMSGERQNKTPGEFLRVLVK